MKKALLAMFTGWMLSLTAGAQLPVYRALPSSDCRTVVLGSRTIIQDARGYFLGYLVPLPPPYVPAPRRAPSPVHSTSSWGGGSNWQDTWDGCPASLSDNDCNGGFSSGSTGSSYSDPGGSPICSPDYGFGR
jgi:hypothetical protein